MSDHLPPAAPVHGSNHASTSSARSKHHVWTVYVVEDDTDARQMLCALLESNGYVVHCFAAAEELLRCGDLARPACAVLDLHLPGMSGLQLQTKLRETTPQLPIIVTTGYGNVGTARTALLAGAVDFLEKPVQPQELLDTVGAALQSDLLTLQRQRESADLMTMIASLTPRENEVFRRITDGQISREIADELGISPRTIETYRARVMEKLKARRLADLFRARRATEPGA